MDRAFPDFASLNPGYGVPPTSELLLPAAHASKLRALLAEHLSRQTTPVDA
jgi:hypothetical protein